MKRFLIFLYTFFACVNLFAENAHLIIHGGGTSSGGSATNVAIVTTEPLEGGPLAATGTITFNGATNFNAPGATNLNGANIASGNIAVARITNGAPSLSIAATQLTGNIALARLTNAAVTVSTTSPLSGGGALTGNLSLTYDGTAAHSESGATALNASNLASGTTPTARLGSGTADNTTFLRGDQTWAVPSGGGGGSVTLTNVVFVSINGSDSTGARNDATHPYLTCRAAQSNALVGDLVFVWPGTYSGTANLNLGKDGVNWYFNRNSKIVFNGTNTANDCIFGDAGSSISYKVGGYGEFYLTNTGPDIAAYAILQSGASSAIIVDGESITVNSTGNSVRGALCSGGSQQVELKSAYCRSGVFESGNPAAYQVVDCKIVQTPNGSAFACSQGTQYCEASRVIAADGATMGASGNEQVFKIDTMDITDEGVKGGAGNQYGQVHRISGGSGTYGVDGAGSAGFQYMIVDEINCGDRGITVRGACTQYVKCQKNTAPNAIVINNGYCTIDGGEHFGNSSTAAVQILNSGNSQTLVLKNATIRNTDASGPVMNIADTTSTNIIYSGCALIGKSGSTYSITGANGAVVKIFGQGIVATKVTDVVNITQQVGTVIPDANVK